MAGLVYCSNCGETIGNIELYRQVCPACSAKYHHPSAVDWDNYLANCMSECTKNLCIYMSLEVGRDISREKILIRTCNITKELREFFCPVMKE